MMKTKTKLKRENRKRLKTKTKKLKTKRKMPKQQKLSFNESHCNTALAGVTAVRR